MSAHLRVMRCRNVHGWDVTIDGNHLQHFDSWDEAMDFACSLRWAAS